MNRPDQTDRNGAAVGTGSGAGPNTGSDLRRSRPVSLILLAIWLGLIAWAFEYAVLSFRRFVLHEPSIWYAESMWLAIVAYVAMFGLTGLVAALLARRGARSRRVAISVLVGLAALSALLVFTSLYRIASFLLALGIGYQVGSIIVSDERRAVRWLRASFAPLAALAIICIIGLNLINPIRAWQGYASLPGAAGNSPNVILLILDTVRARDLSLYGYERPTTPELDELASAGVTFDKAISTASWTLPSHFSMFTGLYTHEMPDRLGRATRIMESRAARYLSDVLREHGYATAGFVANLAYGTDETGLDHGFIEWKDHRINLGQLGISTAPGRTLLNNGRLRNLIHWLDSPVRKHAAVVNGQVLDWLDEHDDRPFFVFANYFDAHSPYLPPPEWAGRWATREPKAGLRFAAHHVVWWDKAGHSKEEIQAQRDMYDAAIAWQDSEVGRLIEALDARGRLDNTLLIVASDHGEEFGEHGKLGHGGHVHTELLHVPLTFWFPGRIPGGVRVEAPVTLADLPATILDVLGIDGDIPGQSLAAAWDPEAPAVPGSPILSHENTGPSLGSLVLDGWHYIRRPNGAEELYDFDNDLADQMDLSADPAAAATLAFMRQAMDSAMAIPASVRIRPVVAKGPTRPGDGQ